MTDHSPTANFAGDVGARQPGIERFGPATVARTLGGSSARFRLRVLVQIMLFWTAWFLVARAIFLAYEWRQARLLNGALEAGLWWHGLRIDLSAAAYLTVIPWLVVVLVSSRSPRIACRLLGGYFLLMLTVTSLITVADLQLFVEWRYRLDSTLIHFLRTPDEALASSASSPWMFLVLLLIALIVGSYVAAHRLVLRPLRHLAPSRVGTVVLPALGGLMLIVPIRGGVQWTPLNPSFAYFSANDFANQAALNASWHFVHATIEAANEPTTNPYLMLSRHDARGVVDSLLARPSAAPPSVLRVARPNVILIVWESLTAKVVEGLGGRHGITPEFDRLSHDGILFDSVFASAGRTPQGLVAILSGFPAQPHEQILDSPHAAASLPMLSKDLSQAGYHTAFYYGGELEFANLKAYTTLGRFDRVVGQSEFARRDRNSKWGAHDHVVLTRAFGEMAHAPRPFFSTVLTLSSHEPFDIPVPPAFAGTGEDTLFLNAHHYADESVGRFIEAARRQPWWDSTLVIIVADHGSRRPVPDPVADERVLDRYHIPMLWLGGALAVRDTVIHTIASQTDIAETLLAQLDQPSSDFRWGSDILSRGDGGFAYFAYHDGFAFIDRRGWMVYDELAHKAVQSGAGAGLEHQRRGAAMLQVSFDDFLAR